jgi:hypothetical protein
VCKFNQANRTLLTSLSICGEDIDNICAESIKEAMKVCFNAAASCWCSVGEQANRTITSLSLGGINFELTNSPWLMVFRGCN